MTRAGIVTLFILSVIVSLTCAGPAVAEIARHW